MAGAIEVTVKEQDTAVVVVEQVACPNRFDNKLAIGLPLWPQ